MRNEAKNKRNAAFLMRNEAKNKRNETQMIAKLSLLGVSTADISKAVG
jgi:hypothetical protein